MLSQGICQSFCSQGVSCFPCPFQGVGISGTGSLLGVGISGTRSLPGMSRGWYVLGVGMFRWWVCPGYPPRQWTMGYGWQMGSMHPTGMLSCFRFKIHQRPSIFFLGCYEIEATVLYEPYIELFTYI